MRGVLACVMTVLVIDLVTVFAKPECEACELAFTIQIHDYARVPGGSLSRARDIVTRFYEKIGVRTEWIGVVRPGERRANSAGDRKAANGPIGQVTLIILTPKMAARGHVAEGVLGYAAVPTEGMGRIAYVIYDRIRQVAAESAASEVDLLGFVMAHEISHLLLPRGSHSDSYTDLMKGRFELRDLRRIDVRKMEFTPIEARYIRKLLEDNRTTVAANAARNASVDAGAAPAPVADPVAIDSTEGHEAPVAR